MCCEHATLYRTWLSYVSWGYFFELSLVVIDYWHKYNRKSTSFSNNYIYVHIYIYIYIYIYISKHFQQHIKLHCAGLLITIYFSCHVFVHFWFYSDLYSSGSTRRRPAIAASTRSFRVQGIQLKHWTLSKTKEKYFRCHVGRYFWDFSNWYSACRTA